MKGYRVIEKKVGETPLQALEAFRKPRPELADVALTYAGRLDPMASGKLLVLVGDECKNRARYDKLDKEYEFEMLLGFKSDTGDGLGLAEICAEIKPLTEKDIERTVGSFFGKHTLPYPAFSSRTVGGVPLFHHAINDTLDDIEIPTTTVRIYNIKFCGMRTISGEQLVEDIVQKISLLQIDATDHRPGSGFRKTEIVARWWSLQSNKECRILKCKAVVSSGTYIRVLVPRIAETLGTCGLAYSIHRTKIGRFQPLGRHFGFWKNFF